MIRSLLIANRGEIACRIIRTAQAMGIRTVTVYSDADARARHVRCADQAVHIGPAAAAESYLRGDRIIAAALATGAQAIHPGYGFLSENADFAEAVIAAGLVWVGPDPASIRAMGLKDAAKTLMAAAGVPVTPGYLGADQTPARLLAEAEKIGFPVLIKAVAGGGGKGMRKVDAAQQFLEMLESCQREAQASFGNAQVLLEKWITSPRHIEVQVFGDRHGNVVHLFERDCSLQRRHQKVIEEAPAPGMDAATRAAICAAAVQAARAVKYVGAGTIEFIADATHGLRADRVFFMEMNTRLQVEHPVTEAITGVDLVEWQLRVTSGESLPLAQDQLTITGHAIEARLYAEDPAHGFLPSPGRVDHLHFAPGARVESGIEQGDRVSSFYDPMVAKVITHGPTREDARAALMQWLDASFVGPMKTNTAFLYRCLALPEFRDANLDTGLIGRNEASLTTPCPPSPGAIDAAAAHYRRAMAQPYPAALGGFRLNALPDRRLRFYADGEMFTGDPTTDSGTGAAMAGDGTLVVIEQGQAHFLSTTPPPPRIGVSAASGAILAPMPGKVTAVDVAAGDHVSAGQRLLVLEAMKMEHALTAPFDGTVAELHAATGAQVPVEALLARVEPSAG
ncbi:MAG: hypothetical protein RLZZ08_958 [Pseudomonadota bacterium]|jgi:3-methylcrotonyl-CoA carboxylase alpha subunit